MDLILTPVRVATSKPARQTYLNTLLFMTTSAILLGLAVIAYILFYFNYMPQIGIERTIHLQYGDGPHPYGIAPLDSTLVADQAYDIALRLHVPRSPPNLETGNFMLSLSLLSPSYIPPTPSTIPPSTLQESPSTLITPSQLLFLSRRPAILTYTSRFVSLSSRILTLPLYILGLKHESQVLHIPMAESAIFKRGRGNVPAYVMLELQTGQQVQVYDVRILFMARFGGMRWLMYNHRVLSFFALTSAFWFAEVVFTGIGWLALRYIFSSTTTIKPEGGEAKEEESESAVVKGGIKEEPETDGEPDLSDTERTFPTYGRQPRLRYAPRVKDEESEAFVMEDTAVQPLEADDEDEGEMFRARDSGIGTSFSEAGGRGGVARRRSGKRGAEGS